MDCIFCNIYNLHKQDKTILHESEHSFVIFDRFPMSTGHLLVIPKIHHSFLHEYKEEEVSDILSVCIKMINKFKILKYNILQNNGNFQSVYHVHFHVIPCVSEIERLKIEWTSMKMDGKEYEEYINKLNY